MQVSERKPAVVEEGVRVAAWKQNPTLSSRNGVLASERRMFSRQPRRDDNANGMRKFDRTLIHVEEAEAVEPACVLAIQLSAIRHFGHATYTRAQIDAWCELAEQEEASHWPGQFRTYLARLAGRVTGYGRIDAEGCIGALYVEPSASRSGVGTALLQAMERAAEAAPPSTLHVAASLNAVAFYRRHGFVAVDSAFFEHPSGLRLAALQMTKLALAAPQNTG